MSSEADARAEVVARTWDGLPIAADHPTGAAVVVRRRRGERVEVLLLHRAANGLDYEGEWAWTSPAGCRQPGEAVYAAALRELAEESGLTGLAPWAVDLSDRWVLFAVDVPPDTEPDLVDPEHDRSAWVDASEIPARVLPARVAGQQVRAALVDAPSSLAFRAMTELDLDAVVRWRTAPHVATWWSEPPEPDEIKAHYRPRIRGDEPVRMWVVVADDEPIGFVQDYLVASDDDYAVKTGDPEAVGLDYAIGDPTRVGRGIGTRMIWEFCRDVVRRDYPGARHILASPSHRNAASLRALAKCGFIRGLWIDAPSRPGKPPDTEIVCTLDVPHWLG